MHKLQDECLDAAETLEAHLAKTLGLTGKLRADEKKLVKDFGAASEAGHDECVGCGVMFNATAADETPTCPKCKAKASRGNPLQIPAPGTEVVFTVNSLGAHGFYDENVKNMANDPDAYDLYHTVDEVFGVGDGGVVGSVTVLAHVSEPCRW